MNASRSRSRIVSFDGTEGGKDAPGKWSRHRLEVLTYGQEQPMRPPTCIQDAMSSETALRVDEEPEIRVEKVMDIRRQLGEGRYSIMDRLDVVIDRIIRDLG